MCFRRIVDGVYRQKKLAAVCIVWSMLCIWQGIQRNIEILTSSVFTVSAADILIRMQHFWEVGVKLVPFMMFVVMRCKMDTLNMQYTVRYTKRKKVLFHQAVESIVYAVCLSVFLVGTETAMLCMYRIPLINWNSKESFYYIITQNVIQETFIPVALSVSAMYAVKFLMIMAVLDILLWYPKGMPLFWVVIILLAGMEGASLMEGKGFYSLFSIQHVTWEPFRRCGIWMFVGALVTMLEYNIGVFLIRKKDIYY